MKRNQFKSIIAGLAVAAIMLPGCKDFLDVNESPNSTTKANPQQILPSIQAAVAHVQNYHYLQFGNFWAQYWTQSPNASQFRSIDAYSSGPSDFDRPWAILYGNSLADTDSLINLSHLTKYKNWAAIAYIFRAYSFQMLTDGFGDIPLTEALQGRGNRSPKYDPQRQVYDSIFAWITKGTALMDNTLDEPYLPTETDDLILAGDMDEWKKFANTLKLRAYLRISETADSVKSKAGILAIQQNGFGYLTSNAQLVNPGGGGNMFPIWEEVLTLQIRNQTASSTVMDKLKSYNDPRLGRLFNLNTGAYTSIPQGGFNDVPSNFPGSRPGARTLGELVPSKLITAAESYFLRAEAALRGWGSGSAAALYEAGIRASFETLELTEAEADTYIAQPAVALTGNRAQQLEKIITQKYFAATGMQGFESWCDYRRLGYPTFLVRSAASVLGVNSRPLRFVYPQAELTRNANFPGLKRIDERVWWDVQ